MPVYILCIRWRMQTTSNLGTLPKNFLLLLTKVRRKKKKTQFTRSPFFYVAFGVLLTWLRLLLPGQTTWVKPFPLIGLLPRQNMSQYYRYHGSLTTPPCSQAVVWTLYEVPVHISWSQVGPQHFSSIALTRWICNLQCIFSPLFSGSWICL